jgi:hypothetical protein
VIHLAIELHRPRVGRKESHETFRLRKPTRRPDELRIGRFGSFESSPAIEVPVVVLQDVSELPGFEGRVLWNAEDGAHYQAARTLTRLLFAWPQELGDVTYGDEQGMN